MRQRREGPPIKISNLFEVYKKRFRAPQGSVVTASVEVVHDLLGITLEARSCEYSPQSRILHIKAHGPMKTEIFLHKEEILAHLKGRLGEKSSPTQIL
jgi:hypothetical protein